MVYLKVGVHLHKQGETVQEGHRNRYQCLSRGSRGDGGRESNENFCLICFNLLMFLILRILSYLFVQLKNFCREFSDDGLFHLWVSEKK